MRRPDEEPTEYPPRHDGYRSRWRGTQGMSIRDHGGDRRGEERAAAHTDQPHWWLHEGGEVPYQEASGRVMGRAAAHYGGEPLYGRSQQQPQRDTDARSHSTPETSRDGLHFPHRQDLDRHYVRRDISWPEVQRFQSGEPLEPRFIRYLHDGTSFSAVSTPNAPLRSYHGHSSPQRDALLSGPGAPLHRPDRLPNDSAFKRSFSDDVVAVDQRIDRLAHRADRSPSPLADDDGSDSRSLTPPSTADTKQIVSQTSEASTSSSSLLTMATTKRSRYLREMDRRIILSRLVKGERQSVLAKEYGVSRSTICNLYKQRDAVLARKDHSPFSRHPKKTRQLGNNQARPATPAGGSQPKRSPSLRNVGDSEEKTSHQEDYFSYDKKTVVEISSPAMAHLSSKLHDEGTSTPDFQRFSDRLMRLVLEESLAIVAADVERSECREGYEETKSHTTSLGICAATMERQGRAMLTAFSHIEPMSPVAWIEQGPSAPMSLVVHDPRLFDRLRDWEIVLLDVVSASGDAVCTAIESLLECGAREERITLVALFVAAEVVAFVQYAYPQVRIICSSIEAQLHRRLESSTPTSSLLTFLERFHGACC